MTMEPHGQSGQPAEQDLSSRVVLVLVVLALAVSFIGAWASISYVMSVSSPPQPAPAADAQVSFTIEPPATDNAVGKVAFEITRPEG